MYVCKRKKMRIREKVGEGREINCFNSSFLLLFSLPLFPFLLSLLFVPQQAIAYEEVKANYASTLQRRQWMREAAKRYKLLRFSSLPFSLSLSLTFKHRHTLSLPLSFSLSLTLSHTYTHTHSHSFQGHSREGQSRVYDPLPIPIRLPGLFTPKSHTLSSQIDHRHS